MIWIYILLGIIGLYLIGIYNSLIKSKNKVDYAIGGIDAMLKKRFDLIPNLIATVKEYMHYEQDTQIKLVELRNSVKSNAVEADNYTTSILKSIMLNAESYPDLKANNSFIQLQQSLNEIEEQLSAARRTYNANVLIFNNKIETIPSNIFARILDYRKMEMFTIKESDKEKPNVKELFKL